MNIESNLVDAVDSHLKILSVADYYETVGARDIARGIKSGDLKAIEAAAKSMAEFIPPGSFLIPIPSRHGRATTTKQLSKKIAEISGSVVCDILVGEERDSLYDKKKNALNIASVDLGFRLTNEAPEGNVFFVDNVVDTGLTAQSALSLVPTGQVITFAETNRANKNKIPDEIEVDGKLRPTRNSRNHVIHTTIEGIANFWRWFGDSKVVDSGGRPQVMYHGTGSDFSIFDLAHSGKNFRSRNLGSELFVFTCEASNNIASGTNASEYAEYSAMLNTGSISGANVIPAYIKIENPQTIDADGWGDPVTALDRQESDIKRWMKAQNNDGAIVSEVLEDGTTYSVVAFSNPHQIKSAVGNRGNYDSNNPDILYSISKPDNEQREPLCEFITHQQSEKLKSELKRLFKSEWDGKKTFRYFQYFKRIEAAVSGSIDDVVWARSWLNSMDQKSADAGKTLNATITQGKIPSTVNLKYATWVDSLSVDQFSRLFGESHSLKLRNSEYVAWSLVQSELHDPAVSEFLKNNIVVDGIYRSKLNDLGNLIHDTDDGIRNFWRWFGDSKITDVKGRPVVQYHGSGASFEEFKLSDRGNFGAGIYFTSSPSSADTYSSNGVVYECYLALKNPLVVEVNFTSGEELDFDSGAVPLINKLFGDSARDYIEKAKASDGKFGSEIIKECLAQGFDGVLLQWDDGNEDPIAFSPTQIKAVNNSGSYLIDESKIRYSFAGTSAKTIDKNALQLAESLEKAQIPAEEIWRKTGFFRAPWDGKWRWEINDQYDIVHAEGSGALMEIGAHFKSGALPAVLGILNGQTRVLNDVLSHDALYKAYPGASDTTPAANIPLKKGSDSLEFVASLTGDGISISRGIINAIKNNSNIVEVNNALISLLHELQHGVQLFEGWEGGGSPREFDPFFNPRVGGVTLKELHNAVGFQDFLKFSGSSDVAEIRFRATYGREITDVERQLAVDDENDELFNRYNDAAEARRFNCSRIADLLGREYLIAVGISESAPFEEIVDAVAAGGYAELGLDEFISLRNSLVPTIELLAELKASERFYRTLALTKSEVHAYTYLAGEAEARLTEKRYKLSPSQRRSRFPLLDLDRPVEDLIVRHTSGGMLNPLALALNAVSSADLLDGGRFSVDAIRKALLAELGDGARTDAIEIVQSIKDVPLDVLMNGDALNSRSVYHGTGNRGSFSAFDERFMGTGEGAASYGWGFYFTDTLDVARSYSRKVSSKAIELDGIRYDVDDGGVYRSATGRILRGVNDSENAAIEALLYASGRTADLNLLAEEVESFLHTRYGVGPSTIVDAKAFIKSGRLSIVDDGIVLEARLKADTDYLLWDAPISSQPQEVQAALRRLPEAWQDNILRIGRAGEPIGAEIYDRLCKLEATGSKIAAVDSDFKRSASLKLKSIGIKGIKYRDAHSRVGMEGGFNYVAFDPALVEIVNRCSVDASEETPQAIFHPQTNKMYLIADALTPSTLRPVLCHEAWHWLVNNQSVTLANLPKLFEDIAESINDSISNDQTQKWIMDALARVPSNVSEECFLEEFMAYAIENYESSGANRVIDKFENLLDEIKTSLIRLDWWPDKINDSHLALMSKYAIRELTENTTLLDKFTTKLIGALKKVEKISSKLTDAFSVRMQRAKNIGFDTSRIFYHGTKSDITNFEIGGGSIAGVNGCELGRGIYVSRSSKVAGKYADGGVIYPLVRKGIYFNAASKDPIGKEVGEKFKNAVISFSDRVALNLIAADAGHPKAVMISDDKINLENNYDYRINVWEQLDGRDRNEPQFTSKNSITYVDYDAFPDISNLQSDKLVRALKLFGGEMLTNVLASIGFDGIDWDDQSLIFEAKNLRSTNAEFSEEKINSTNILHSFSNSNFNVKSNNDKFGSVTSLLKLSSKGLDSVGSIKFVEPYEPGES